MTTDINKYTHQDALAYVAITGDTKSLHDKTLKALKKELEQDAQGRFKPTREARPVAQRSRLWKAHTWLTDEGFALNEYRGPGQLVYTKRGARAETSRLGAVYVKGKERARFLNG